MKHIPFSRKTLVLVLGTIMHTGVHAQTEGQAPEEIIVYGSELSRARAIEQKRNAVTVMDAMSVDDLGRLPDKNAAESINRLPGVSVLVEKGEGRFAAIRGIKPDWNSVTINGFQTGSPEKDGSGRQVALDVLGGEMLESVQVIKARTPDMDGQGIGGTVNLVPKRPLDIDRPVQGTLLVRGGMEEADQDNPFYDDEMPWSVDSTWMGRINEDLGWIIGGSMTSRQYLAQGIYQDIWKQVTPQLAYPEATKNNYYVIGRERTSFNAGLDYRLSQNTRLMVQGFYSQFEEFQHRNRFYQGIEQDAGSIQSVDGTGFTMQPGATSVSADLRYEEIEKTISNLSITGETTLDSWLFSYGANLGQTSIDEPNYDWRFASDVPVPPGPDRITIDGDGIASVEVGGLQHNLPSNLKYSEVRFQDDSAEEDLVAVFMDASLPWQLAGNDSEIKFGVKYSSNDKSMDYANNRYRGAGYNLASISGLTQGGFLNDVDGSDRSNVWFDLDAFNTHFANNTDPAFYTEHSSNLSNQLASDRSIEEEVGAVYVMNTLQLDRLQLIAGVRYEETDIRSTANQERNGSFLPVSVSGSSDAVLPSLIANYNLTDNLLLRASWTTSIGRPDLGSLSASSSFSVDANGVGQLNIGNPDLQPRESDNYDLSLEWYLSTSSMASLAWFRKDVENEIITRTTVIDGGNYLGTDYGVNRLNVNTSVNADKAEVEGLEFNLQYQFDILPSPFDGLGASLSLTEIEASFFDSGLNADRPLEGQPESSQSLTLFYTKGSIDLAVTYNYNDSFLTDLEDFNNADDDLYQGEFGRWDVRASYNLNDRYSFFFEGVNLNNEPTTEFQGGRENWNTEYEYVGATYYLGMTVSF